VLDAVSVRDSHPRVRAASCDGDQVGVDDVVDVEENVELESSR
jgi:hypothetical protein